MTIRDKYIKLFVKFLKKEKLIGNDEMRDYFNKYVKPTCSKGCLPYSWFNSVVGEKFKLEEKYWFFIEEIFVEDIMKLFRSNNYTRDIDENDLRQQIKKKMRHYEVMGFCCKMLHKSFSVVLMDFYNL